MVGEGKRVIFADTMRYGLIINLWRTHDVIGVQLVNELEYPMEFERGYLWAEIEPSSGDFNIWLLDEYRMSQTSSGTAFTVELIPPFSFFI